MPTRNEVVETLRNRDRVVLVDTPESAANKLRELWTSSKLLRVDRDLHEQYLFVEELRIKWILSEKMNRSIGTAEYYKAAFSQNLARLQQNLLWKILNG